MATDITHSVMSVNVSSHHSSLEMKALPLSGKSTRELRRIGLFGNPNAAMVLAHTWWLSPNSEKQWDDNNFCRIWWQRASKSGHPVPRLYLDMLNHSSPNDASVRDQSRDKADAQLLMDQCLHLAQQGDILSIHYLTQFKKDASPSEFDQWIEPLDQKAKKGDILAECEVINVLLFAPPLDDNARQLGEKRALTASKNGNIGAMELLGRYYFSSGNTDVAPNREKDGIVWLKQAAVNGHCGAARLLLNILDDNEQQFKEGLQTMLKNRGDIQALLADADAQHALGNHEKELISLNRAAIQDSVEALARLVHYYDAKQSHNAIDYLEKMVDLHSVKGMLTLASRYERGIQVPQNLHESWALVNRAAKSPIAQASLQKAIMLMKGIGTPANPEEAYGILKKLEKNQGDMPKLYFLLGYMNEMGIGVESNINQAFIYYSKGAELGDTSSMNNLASMYEQGSGMSPDLDRAEQWYKKGAEKGNEEASFNLERLLTERAQ
ncbi:MAG: tetratricopeptide repeat protein [Akkermansia sp.]